MPNSQEVDTILRAAVSAENVEVLKREIDAGADIEIVRSRYSHEDGEYKLHSLIYIAIFLEKWSSFINGSASKILPLLGFSLLALLISINGMSI